MSKSKKVKAQDDEVIPDEIPSNTNEEIEAESEKDMEGEMLEIIDDEESSDIIIEIDEDDLDFGINDDILSAEEEDESDQEDPISEEEEDIVLSKHTLEGKHSLKYDSIFKGKKEEFSENDDFDVMISNEKFEVDKSSQYWFESIDNENYTKEKRVKEKVYEVLSNNTDINFLSNRRKPSKVDFNHYYFLLKTNLKGENFTNIEIFNELSVYFSDNLFNMFKLLDNKWRNMIIGELQDHIGKKNYSNEVTPRNIHEGTEIEFEWVDIIDNKIKLITGVVVESDYEVFEYKVDSYENIYVVSIKHVRKILNNSKYKYNLNKLNNIDFL